MGKQHIVEMFLRQLKFGQSLNFSAIDYDRSDFPAEGFKISYDGPQMCFVVSRTCTVREDMDFLLSVARKHETPERFLPILRRLQQLEEIIELTRSEQT